MSALIVDEAMLREPSLLVPGRKPLGLVIGTSDLVFAAWPENPISVGLNQPWVLGSTEVIECHSLLHRFGSAWYGGATSQITDFTQFVGGASYALAAFTAFIIIAIPGGSTLASQGIFGNFIGTEPNRILVRTTTAETIQFYLRDSANNQYGPATSPTMNLASWLVISARYDGATITAYANGVGGTPVNAAGGTITINAANPLQIGYLNSSQGANHNIYTAAVVLLRRACSDAEIAEVSVTGDVFRYLKPA